MRQPSRGVIDPSFSVLPVQEATTVPPLVENVLVVVLRDGVGVGVVVGAGSRVLADGADDGVVGDVGDVGAAAVALGVGVGFGVFVLVGVGRGEAGLGRAVVEALTEGPATTGRVAAVFPISLPAWSTTR
jgi:hypothetical protein